MFLKVMTPDYKTKYINSDHVVCVEPYSDTATPTKLIFHDGSTTLLVTSFVEVVNQLDTASDYSRALLRDGM